MSKILKMFLAARELRKESCGRIAYGLMLLRAVEAGVAKRATAVAPLVTDDLPCAILPEPPISKRGKGEALASRHVVYGNRAK